MKTASPFPVSLTVFFPAYNEEANIVSSVTEAMRTLEASPFVADYEIIVIDDGSADATRALVADIAARHGTVRLVAHEENRGYGAALQTGLQAARKEYVFFTDADLQFDIVELQNLLVHLPTHEVVIGYRAPRKDPMMRIANALGWKMLNRMLFGLRVRDIDCAFKVFKRELVQKLDLYSKGAMVSAEILIRLSRDGVRLKEVPVSHLPRRAGSPTGAKLSVIARAFREMVALYSTELGSVTHKQVLKFMAVGVVNTAIDLLGYLALTRGIVFFSEHLLVAKALSFMLGTVSSFALNRTWTFGMRSAVSFGEIVRFYALTSLSLMANVALMNLFLGAGVYDIVALCATTLFTFVIGFTVSKAWVFRTRPALARAS